MSRKFQPGDFKFTLEVEIMEISGRAWRVIGWKRIVDNEQKITGLTSGFLLTVPRVSNPDLAFETLAPHQLSYDTDTFIEPQSRYHPYSHLFLTKWEWQSSSSQQI